MKISIEDPGFFEKLKQRPVGGDYIRIFLDGEELNNVTSANEESGEVTRYKTLPNGNFVVVGDMVESETLHGKVQIIMPKWWPK